MELNKKKASIQQKALESWLEIGKSGTIEMITGGGKTFIALNALYTMPKNNDVHLFLAETTTRKQDLDKDITKYNKLFKRNVYKDYNLRFHCYQEVYKWKNRSFGIVIADEIHDSLSPAYSKFYFNNKFKSIIGLSATVIRDTKYEINGKVVTKGQLLDKIAPVCFKYGIDQGQEDGTSRKLDIYIIQHRLDSLNKNIEAGNRTKRFKQTEKAAYDYWDKEHKKSWYIKDEKIKQFKIRVTSTRRSQILYNLKSKIEPIKKLLSNIKGKTIIFGNSIPILEKITPNVVSSYNSEDENKRIREDFDKNRIQVIGSFKKLKQGANLNDLDNAFIISYYSTSKDLIQRLGRLRKNGDKIGNLFIFVTMGTQEEKWFDKMFNGINAFNMIYCPNVDYCIKKLNKKQ